ncbi:unnamed protein product [Linum tenue]|uniref:Uncharacterized protein n=1 Tax=Linum tenue TaxID=586396 RepID=A0AAV0LAV8_9ROSI|nr:unnamed protein product [Linum tenue]
MSWVNNYQLAELTWKKGQLSMNGLGSTQNPTPKPIWAGSSRNNNNNNNNNDTLESIVHQATFLKPPPAAVQPPPDTKSATTGPCRKRIRQGDGDQRGCATAAASGGESDGTVMTWPLPASFQTSCKRTALQPHKDHASRARSELEEDGKGQDPKYDYDPLHPSEPAWHRPNAVSPELGSNEPVWG